MRGELPRLRICLGIIDRVLNFEVAEIDTATRLKRDAEDRLEDYEDKIENIEATLEEVRAELRKVTWPTRQETMNLTVAVVGMTVGIAAFLGLVDGLLDKIIQPLIGG